MNIETLEERREFLRAELEILTDEELQEMVFDCCCEDATREMNQTDDEDEQATLLSDAEYNASFVCDEGRERMIEWIIDWDLPL